MTFIHDENFCPIDFLQEENQEKKESQLFEESENLRGILLSSVDLTSADTPFKGRPDIRLILTMDSSISTHNRKCTFLHNHVKQIRMVSNVCVKFLYVDLTCLIIVQNIHVTLTFNESIKLLVVFVAYFYLS